MTNDQNSSEFNNLSAVALIALVVYGIGVVVTAFVLSNWSVYEFGFVIQMGLFAMFAGIFFIAVGGVIVLLLLTVFYFVIETAIPFIRWFGDTIFRTEKRKNS
jgi:hypothetical protein